MNAMTSIGHPQGDLVLDRIRSVLPDIEARGDEIESGGRVPLDLLDRLQEAGAFRICVPRQFGGEELSQSEACQIITEVATVDASVAWHLMVAAGTQIITARLPLASLETYYSNGPDTWAKTAASPKGMAVAVEGGYRLSGRWPLASGARTFEWIALGFMIKEEKGIRRLPNGMPDMRVCLVPRGDVQVIETWNAVGLRGTRSDDLEVTDMFIPDAWQGPFFGPSSVMAPTFMVGMPAATATHHLAVVKGILHGAVADTAKDSLTRRPAFNPTMLMKDEPVFRSRFGEIASRVDGLCCLADMCVAMLETCDRERRDATPAETARIGSAQSLVHHEGTSVMDQLMMLSGSSGVYMTNRLQRRWRDLRCVAQHMAANIGNYAGYAGSLIDQAGNAGLARDAATRRLALDAVSGVGLPLP